jgi:transposase
LERFLIARSDRHRLDRGRNRQIDAAIHRIAITRARCHPETRDYLARVMSADVSRRA